jgi:hypothetical protein
MASHTVIPAHKIGAISAILPSPGTLTAVAASKRAYSAKNPSDVNPRKSLVLQNWGPNSVQSAHSRHMFAPASAPTRSPTANPNFSWASGPASTTIPQASWPGMRFFLRVKGVSSAKMAAKSE